MIIAAITALALLGNPISDARARVTKKPFGIYVRPRASPVTPERFRGYHAGVDFDALPGEQMSNVTIYAVCDGVLLRKATLRGYGGVAIQLCKLENKPITVLYGHVKLTSVTIKVGQKVTKGETLAVLGRPYSAETGGERKHLHLGIHQGTKIDTRGYVQNKSELKRWLDALKYIP